MNSNHKESFSLEDLAKQLREVKFQHSSVSEKFDLEIFILGYLSALQSLNGVNKLEDNLKSLVTLRNLELSEKISPKEKLEFLSQVVNLTNGPLNSNVLQNFNILPEKLKVFGQDIQKEEAKILSPTLPMGNVKRSKSNEGKQNIGLEKVSKPIVNNLQTVCILCGNKIRGQNSAKLPSCNHILHDNCLRSYLHSEIDEQSYPIRCPISDCGKEIQPAVIQTRVDGEHGKKYWTYAFSKNLNRPEIGYSWCPTQGCNYFYIAQKPLLMMFRCPLCQKHNCLNCRAEYHRGQSCDVYQKSHNINMPKFDKEVVRFKQCPSCSQWVESKGVKNFMSPLITYNNKGYSLNCSCGKEFCVNCSQNPKECSCQVKRYATGGNRGPMGSNDYEETLLYKMIMKDQEDEKLKLKENFKYQIKNY